MPHYEGQNGPAGEIRLPSFQERPSTSWTYVPPGSVMPSEVSPGRVEPQAKPEERKSEAVPSKPDASADPTPKELAKPKRVAQQPRYEEACSNCAVADRPAPSSVATLTI